MQGGQGGVSTAPLTARPPPKNAGGSVPALLPTSLGFRDVRAGSCGRKGSTAGSESLFPSSWGLAGPLPEQHRCSCAGTRSSWRAGCCPARGASAFPSKPRAEGELGSRSLLGHGHPPLQPCDRRWCRLRLVLLAISCARSSKLRMNMMTTPSSFFTGTTSTRQRKHDAAEQRQAQGAAQQIPASPRAQHQTLLAEKRGFEHFDGCDPCWWVVEDTECDLSPGKGPHPCSIPITLITSLFSVPDSHLY